MARGADTHNAGRDEKRESPSQTPWNEEGQSEPLHEEPRTMEVIIVSNKSLDKLMSGGRVID
jgi:hypothetical protein